VTAVVADTVTIVWWLSDDQRLSDVARKALEDADAGDGIYVSAITLIDLWYATHKRNNALTLDQLAEVDFALADPEVNIHVVPVTADIARFAWEPARVEVPDPFDRIILATARARTMPLVSPDTALRSVAVAPAVW
jgi:PIN domain nuclease of toxin-antitoxin system